MTKNLLFSVLFLLMGVSVHAQSVTAEQMDERFNDGTNLPYGWFTEGWTVKDGAIQTEASSGFDLSSLMGTGGGDPENQKGDDPEENPGDDPQTDPGDDPETDPGDEKGGFDISKLLESLMGGGSNANYLLTPPLQVNEGEALVFSAKKAASNSSFSLGSSDSTFVIERSVYSRNQWVRVADFTAELDTLYKTFTITDIPAGEYRFRFKAGGTVLIDSVAGCHIDTEAPDIYIIENDARAKHIDFSLCTKDSTRTLKVINTATGTLKLGITSDDAALFTIGKSEIEVAAADTLDVDITFNLAAGQPGKNEAQIIFRPADERVYGKTLFATAVVTQPGVWMEDFNANAQPKGFFTEGWEFRDSVATTSSGGGMASMFGGGGSSSFLMTPPLIVEDINEVLLFSVKGSGDSMAGMGSLFGGGSSSIVVEKSVYGSNKWSKVKEFTEPLDSTYRTLWVGYIDPGEYRFRIIASDSIVVDSIAGFHIDNNAPDIYVLHNNTAAASYITYGMPQASKTEALAVVNTGTGTLQVGVASTNEKDFAISSKALAIEANDTATVEVTYVFDQESIGMHEGNVSFTPESPVLSPLSYYFRAYSTYADAWSEDFEPEFIPEDETQPRELPAGWETDGWEVKLPSSGGLMDMLGGLMGGGNSAPKSWMATTSSESYELITPRLQAMKGDALGFYVELGGGGGLMDMLGMFMGGSGASGFVDVSYKINNDDDWTYFYTIFENGNNYFVAPYSGVYQIRFTSPGAKLDNFYGFRKPIETVGFSDDADDTNVQVLEEFDGKTVNVINDRVLSASDNGNGTFTPRAYTVCLPYDMALGDYVEPGIMKLYKLSFIDKYYNQFIFTSVSDTIEAGKAYLAVVDRDEARLDAIGVTLKAQANIENEAVVNDYEDWFFNDNLTKVGQWTGNFKGISATEADNVNMFCLLDDGTWARFTSADNPDAKLSVFRGYFLSDEAPAQSARANSRNGQGVQLYRTLFSNAGTGSVSGGSVPDAVNMLYSADIPTPSSITDIPPVIQTIEADGSCRYFDLQGRMLSGKPAQSGLFINGDGIKFGIR